jgi:hypothetical protein
MIVPRVMIGWKALLRQGFGNWFVSAKKLALAKRNAFQR